MGIDFKWNKGVTQIAKEANYVYFNVLNGKGEKGQVSIIVNSDGSGNAGESSAIDIEFKKIGSNPAEYTYAAS